MKRVILGVDPGSRITGVAALLLRDDGAAQLLKADVICIPKNLPFEEKLLFLKRSLMSWAQEFSFKEMVVEKVFLGKNADSAFKLGHARGICMLVAAELGATVYEYAAKKVKKMITGSGNASKEQVRFVLAQEFGPLSGFLDQSDALALAYCHWRYSQVNLQLERLL
ncbi:MAG: crossover junction endodeoxyribonuclease RuvC [Bdellovibrio sp.]|nr:MAG: crossover junction endodeoxyribonuclease RuvC [Bdellovibrio sp.]